MSSITGHLVNQCHRYQFSKYPQTSLRVISYKVGKFEFPDFNLTPSKAALKDEKSLKKLKKKKSRTCPNTPDIKIPENFMSQPASPVTTSFPTTLLVEKAWVNILLKINQMKFLDLTGMHCTMSERGL